ncbi:MAG TPA: YigZ family protein [Bacteroidota bacterium]|nr:YigZ family protein [Bacteroidota bacterium]HRT67186.1 YigZ family protein [Bacteroidota bacterium]
MKKSKFIGNCFPITISEEIEEILNNIRKEHYTANHNCYAYRIGIDDNNFRYSDDGEPSGTAGKPILQAIDHFKYKNVLVIVTRYFGGIKLGVGPLFRAYYDSALGCLAEALPKKIFITRSYKVVSDYNNITLLKRIFEKYAINYNANYSEVVEFYPNVLISQVNEFENELINKFNGKVHFEIIEKIDGNN